MANDTQTDDVRDDELLTKTECRYLFMEKLKISKTGYYDDYHKSIRFHYLKKERDQFGNLHGRKPRIPRRIVIGLIHYLGGLYNEKFDPPLYELKPYVKEGVI
jgi:hypothetical protein